MMRFHNSLGLTSFLHKIPEYTMCTLYAPLVNKCLRWTSEKQFCYFKRKTHLHSLFRFPAGHFHVMTSDDVLVAQLSFRCRSEICVMYSCSKTVRAPKCVSRCIKTLWLSAAVTVKSRSGTPNYENGGGTDGAPVAISDARAESTLHLVEHKQLKETLRYNVNERNAS